MQDTRWQQNLNIRVLKAGLIRSGYWFVDILLICIKKGKKFQSKEYGHG